MRRLEVLFAGLVLTVAVQAAPGAVRRGSA